MLNSQCDKRLKKWGDKEALLNGHAMGNTALVGLITGPFLIG